jgi:RND family efflux transporter MFP subunit
MVADRSSWLAVIALGALALSGCQADRHAPAAASTPLVVEAVRVGAGAPGTLTLPARVKATEEATLTARTAGRVSAFMVREGQSVAEGALLVRFDAPEARRQLEASRAAEIAARAAAEVASRQQARVESLYAAGVLAIADRENAESNQRAAESRLAQAASTREGTEWSLEVRAPFAGKIVRRHVDAGADVQPGQPLLDVRSQAGAEVVTAVPEAAAAGLAAAKAWIQVADGAWWPARLTSSDGMVDPATRSRTARFMPRAFVRLEPGAFARVRLEAAGVAPAAGRREPVAVPRTSLVLRGALTGVLVIEGDRAWLRWVRLGRVQGDQVEVLSGLEGGEQIVARPAGVADGTRVRVAS